MDLLCFPGTVLLCQGCVKGEMKLGAASPAIAAIKEVSQ